MNSQPEVFQMIVPALVSAPCRTMSTATPIALAKPKESVPPDLARQLKHGYYAAVSYMDAQVGKVLAALRETGQEDETLIVFTSDHGEMLGDHGYFRKCEPFEGAANIPFLVAGSPELGFKAGLRSLQPVCLEDVMPTLLDLTRTSQEVSGG